MKNKDGSLKIGFSLFCIGILLCISITGGLEANARLEQSYQENHTNYILSNWEWTTTEIVSTESTGVSSGPSVAVDSKGNVHIAWADQTSYGGSGTDEDIFYKYWNTATTTWTITQVVSTESTLDSINPSLAVDSKGNVHIAWQDSTDYAASGADKDIFYKCWNATTFSWTTTEVVSIGSDANCFTPSLAVDSKGNVHIAWQDYSGYYDSGLDPDVFYKQWYASNSSWLISEVVSTESPGISSNSPSLAVDSTGNVHIAWFEKDIFDNDEVYYKYKDVMTSTWTTSELVSTGSTTNSWYPSVAVDSMGNVHIVWTEEWNYLSSGNDWDICHKCWNTTTSSWETAEIVSTESTGDSFYPAIAIDSMGDILIAWEDSTYFVGEGTDGDILFKQWDAYTSEWSITRVLSTESSSYSGQVAISFDASCNFHIAWEDSTEYGISGVDQDIFYKELISPTLQTPELAYILPNPSEVDTIFLDWDDVYRALEYYIYRSDSYIWSVVGLIPIDIVETSFYTDILPDEGYYFYVIVATDGVRNSTLSNCQYVLYEIPHLQEFILIGGFIAIAITISSFAFRKHKNR